MNRFIFIWTFSSNADYLESHKESVDEFSITPMDDCAHVFHKVPYNSENKVVREKWQLIGQCLSKVCSKCCTWSEIEVCASTPNVCDYYTTVAEEAIVYWLFVSEGKEWLHEFEASEGCKKPEEDTDTTSTQRKKCGRHKMLSYLKHWWQLKTIVRLGRFLHVTREEKKRMSQKRSIQDVLPMFEDGLGIGESEVDYTSGLNIVEDLALFVTQDSDV
jgi:hypothetical protein